MDIVIFGATGMVGQGVLRECLLDPAIGRVVTVGRTAATVSHPKLQQIRQDDLLNYGPIEPALTGFGACFFCLGISSSGIDAATYERITYGITLAAATVLCRLNPGMVFTYITGAGTDTSEQGRSAWARVKGRTENALLRLPFKGAYMFRPGVIVPLHGARSKTRSYRWFYKATKPLLVVLEYLFPRLITTTSNLGLAMIEVAKYGTSKHVLETSDIHDLVQLAKSRAVSHHPF